MVETPKPNKVAVRDENTHSPQTVRVARSESLPTKVVVRSAESKGVEAKSPNTVTAKFDVFVAQVLTGMYNGTRR